MNKRILILTSGSIVVAVTVGYLVFSTFFSAKPLTQAELAVLSPDWAEATGGKWSPWYTTPDGTTEWNPTAGFNAWIETIAEEDKAWPTIARVLLDHEEIRDHEWGGAEPHEMDNWYDVFQLFYKTENRTAVDDLVHAMHAPVLGVVDREGTDPVTHQLMIDRDMEDFDWVVNPAENPDPWINIISIQPELRNVASILSTAAYSALKFENDTERYLDIVSAMFDGADLSLTRTRMIDYLVYLAVYKKSLSVVEWALVNHPDKFDEIDLAQLDWILEAFPLRPFKATDEILALHDHYRRVTVRFGNLDADRVRDVPRSWVDQEFVQPSHQPITKLDPRLRQIILYQSRQYKKIARKSALPWDGTELTYGEFHEGLDRIPTGMHDLAKGTEFLIWHWEMNLDAQLRATALRIAIAAERHKRRRRAYPYSIDQIDADLMQFDINDPFTNEPLLYVLSYAGPVIYSAGTDRDDDNGIPMRSLYLNPNYARVNSYWSDINTDGGVRSFPHWISREQAEGIEDQSVIDGDWVLYPEPDYSDD